MVLRHWMLKATVLKSLSISPASRSGYRLFQRSFCRSLTLDCSAFEKGLDHCRKHLENYFCCCAKPQPGFSVFELGTGWYPIIPIGMYLCGAAQIWTVDIEPLLNGSTVRKTLAL